MNLFKKYSALFLAVIMLFCAVSLAGCSKSDGGDENGSAIENIPEGFEQVDYTDDFYGVTVSAALPTYEGIEQTAQPNGCSFKGNINAADSSFYNVAINVDISDEESKGITFSEAGVEKIEMSSLECCKDVKSAAAGRETVYTAFSPFLEGYIRVMVDASLLNINSMTEEEWNDLTDTLEQTVIITVGEGGMNSGGRIYDGSKTMAFENPATIYGQEVELTYAIENARLVVTGTLTIDDIPYRIYAKGDIPKERFDEKAADAENYTAFRASGNRYYCRMVNSFPSAECDLFTEIDGVCYSFAVFRDHNLDVKKNRDYIDDSSNCEFFAELVGELVSNAKIDTSSYATG